MTTEHEARGLKRAMGQRGRGRQVPANVRAAALRYARRRRREGASQQRIADELGISQYTVSRWLRGAGGESESESALVPVEIDYGTPAARSEIVVTTPRGLRIVDCEIAAVTAFLQSLRQNSSSGAMRDRHAVGNEEDHVLCSPLGRTEYRPSHGFLGVASLRDDGVRARRLDGDVA